MKKMFCMFTASFSVLFAMSCIFSQSLAAQERGLNVVAAEHLGKQAQIGKQYALLIAIDRYPEWPPLKKPVADAQEIRDILREQYYIDEFIELYDANATRANIARAFTDLQGRLNINDSLFIYYAGHGYLDPSSQQGFWIPVDAGLDEYEQDKWLANSLIRGYISRLKTIHVFMISDACFSGEILNTDRAKPAAIDNAYYRRAYSLVSRLVLTSGSRETVPDESEFSQALKMCLRKNTAPLLDPYAIHNDVRLAVRETTPLLGSLAQASHQDGATFIFFRQPLQAASAPQAAPSDWTPTRDFDLELGEHGVTIKKYKGTGETVNIPAMIDGSPVTTIGDGAFRGCTSLRSISIPSSVTAIGDEAFTYCSSLRSISIPSSVTAIGDYAFAYCSSLTSITVDALNRRYSAANGILFSKDGKTLVCYPAGKVYTSYTIPSSVTAIGDGAFYGCSSLSSISIPSGVTAIGVWAFSGCTSLSSISIPSGVTAIGDSAFEGCTSLRSISIPSSVTAIGNSAFRDCSRLSSISIPSSVTAIGDGAFAYCGSLTSITVDALNTRYSAANGILFSKDGKTLVCYPAGKVYTSYTIPSSVTAIGNSAFAYCSSLSSITVDALNTRYSAANGILFSKDGKTLVCYPAGKVYTSYTIPSSVTAIGGGAFSGCTSLSSINIPSSVTAIGGGAFSGCSSLSSISIPSSVTAIGDWAFASCSSLSSINIPSSVTAIGDRAFYGCDGLSAESHKAIRRRFGDWVF
jgi:hypothetical protein